MANISPANEREASSAMNLEFITTEVKFTESPVQLLQVIEAELRCCGEPLRWAITSVDLQRQTATVEAVITSTHNTSTTV